MNDTDLYGFSLEKYGFPSRNCGVSVGKPTCESETGFQKDPGETIELLRARFDER